MAKEKKQTWLNSATKVVGLNPTTFQEKWSIQWKGYQLISALFIVLIVVFILFYLLLVFTPLSNILPKEVTTESQQELFELYTKTEEYTKLLDAQEAYILNLQNAILGKVSIDSIFSNEEDLYGLAYENLDTTEKEVEKQLGQQIDNRLSNDISEPSSFAEFYLVDPIKGTVSQKYNKKTHPAIDIVAAKDEPILACLEGVVMHTSYNDLDGWIVMIKHPTDITSVYKHCSKVLIGVGDFVDSGDPIGIVGNSGENSSGPHLHFELWNSNGTINPLDYLSFKKE